MDLALVLLLPILSMIKLRMYRYEYYLMIIRCSFWLLTDIYSLQGYVGYLPTRSSIFVVFRGSTSIRDWLNNIDVIQTKYAKCTGCEVHKGFYDAEQTVINSIIAHVNTLKQQFPSYTVIVTGHSLG
jgi:predicted lipase